MGRTMLVHRGGVPQQVSRRELVRQLTELRTALAESVKLQAHYAELLNMHDGGQRMVFRTSEEWLERLRRTR